MMGRVLVEPRAVLSVVAAALVAWALAGPVAVAVAQDAVAQDAVAQDAVAQDAVAQDAVAPTEASTSSETAATAQDTTSTTDAATTDAATTDAATTDDGVRELATETRRALVIDTATYGIDAIVGRVATDRARQELGAMGYDVLTRDETVATAQRIQMTYPPTPADLWRVAFAAQTHRAIFLRVWSNAGRYVIEIVVASLDGTGPFFGRVSASQADFREQVSALVQSTVPPASRWRGAAEVGAGPVEAPFTARPAARLRSVRLARHDLGDPAGRASRWRPSEPDIRRFSVAIQTEGSIGTTQGSFYNHFVGGRFDFRLTRDFLIGVYAAYVNVSARDGRRNNVFVMLQAESRIRPSSTSDLTIPLRVGVGYLPFNGPVIRGAAGVNVPLSTHWEFAADIVAPTFYVLPDRLAVAFDIAAEVAYRF